MMESRLISAFRKTKSIVNQISSNSRLSRSEICIFNEPSLLIHSKTYTSFSSNLIPASQTSIIRSLSNLGFKAFRHHYPNYKGFCRLSFRNLSTAAAASIEKKDGLKLLVTAGPHARKLVGIWLFGSAAWVFSMVVLGGMTRLTRSGLSMTDWKFTGRLPPLTDEDWLVEFEKYKQSPEYKRSVEDPASEYAEPRVSPYRLAAHLTSAFVIYSGLFWTALSVVMPEPPAKSVAWVKGAAKVKRLAIPVSILVGITAVSGAFVAGNDAGRAFNTFPKMGDTWVPKDIFSMKPLLRNFFENTSTVQLDHRILATTTLAAIGGLWFSTRKLDLHPAIRSLIGSIVGMAALQVTLGVSTLLSYVPVSLGTAHQAGALTLLSLMLLLNHTVRRPSMSLLKTLPPVVKTVT
ncbi:heme A synthase COX15-like isoform X2 [Coffea arabica]|uniref:Heme A synthase COX15-like isoform X2 n=1 Tax=Coffea arabica TaxID=13443 RepID=A0ABM4WEQ3_COFAR